MSITLGTPAHNEPALSQLIERDEEGFLLDAGLHKPRKLILDV
jgi:hypothetical protein